MAGPTDNMRGALLMVGSMAAFTLNDTFMKLVGETVPLMQAIFLRGVVVSLILYLALRQSGGLNLSIPKRDRWLVFWRVLAEVLTAYFFLTALLNMPLANVTAILQVTPLSVALAGAIFLKEPLGWRRLSAIAIGFLGVMLIVRPGTEGFNIYSVYTLIAVGLITLRDIATRKLSPQVSSMSVALATALAVTIAGGLVSLFQPWAPVTASSALMLGGAALAILFAYLMSVMTMRVGDIAFIAPFRYSALIAALILGYLVFGDWPDALTLIGAAVVVATGLFTFYRERQLSRAQDSVRA